MSDRGYIYYPSFHEALKDLPPEEFKECQLAINNYALFGIENELSPVAKMFFTLVKPQIDANRKRYENGMKGGRPRKSEEPNDNQKGTEVKPKQNQAEPKADVERLPLKDGSEWECPVDVYEELCRLYPANHVKKSFRDMRAWLITNESKRKTRVGIKRFVNGWLSREANSGTKLGGQPVVIEAPNYIKEQMEGTLPKEEKASTEDIEKIKKLQEKMRW